MDFDTLQKAKNLESLIKSEEANIKAWEELFKASEITLSSATRTQKMYLTGSKKEEVKSLITKYSQERLTKFKNEFEKL